MSFIKIGTGRRKKAFVRKKPIWDDSVSDLDAHRASPEEIRRRKELHKSKNHIAVKLEMMRKEKQRQHSGLTNVEARQVAIMKEVLHDQEQLESVLAKTDQMMAMVKDLFGDDAKKYRGVPNITLPPGDSKRPGNLMPFVPEIQTRSEKLSESVMNTSALNDLSETSDSETEEQQPTPISFQSVMDIHRFQQFLQEEENRNTNASISDLSTQVDTQRLDQLRRFLIEEARHSRAADGAKGLGAAVGSKVRSDDNQTLSTISGRAETQSHLGHQGHGPVHSTQLQASVSQGQQTPPRQEADAGQKSPKSALNDTGKVNKTKQHSGPGTSQNVPGSFNMSDMRKVLDALQTEIADFELQTGRRPATGVPQTETFSGYTIALVTAVTKLTHYLRETEKRLQVEMMVREQLTQDVRQLAVTVDSLTSEVIMTQEEYVKISGEYQRYRQQMQGEMAVLNSQILDLKHQQSAQASQHSTPGRAASAGPESGDVDFAVISDRLNQPSTAVLLSPIVRKTRVTDGMDQESLKSKRQTSLVDIASLAQADGCMQALHSSASANPATVTSVASSSSSSSTVHSEPPRLTQIPPVLAKVSVPRPIPLVQSNIGAPLSGSQAAGPINQTAPMLLPQNMLGGASGNMKVHHLGVPWVKSVPGGPRPMEEQIAELNRQHAEAQQRLQSLLGQQKLQHEQLQMFSVEDLVSGENMQEVTEKNPASILHARQHPTTHFREKAAVQSAVSPPISPISQRSEHFTSLKPLQAFASVSREIKVALPMVDLNVSGGSSNSP